MRVVASLKAASPVGPSNKVDERAPYLEETGARTGAATWKPFDRATVEALVTQKV